MINIVSWNIQCGRGTDGQIDFARIAHDIKKFGDVDVICLQEVARYDPELDDGEGADQMALLSVFFPEYESFFGPALSRRRKGDEHRRQFGNMILSKVPVLQMFNHLLPQPVPPVACKNMIRQALEIVVVTQTGPLRITTSHLEYHSEFQRLAQAERLCEIQNECARSDAAANVSPPSGPYAKVPRPINGVMCGDFNSLPDDPVYGFLTDIKKQPAGFLDAWLLAHPDTPHAPTCGVFDRQQWPEGAHCRDFFFLTKGLETAVITCAVNQQTAASDHQPILLTLAC
ncbi:Metal-dependent hydrolase [hydrothermal vent metagenome]|uniref:Metal-dependent hydrolase n=1 Tax=hydrothermal vent metagenome TaxID=652676 RepID=A0A3B0R584_9ZZZZ